MSNVEQYLFKYLRNITFIINFVFIININVDDPINKEINAIQMVQNKLARLINGKSLKDKIRTKVLLDSANLLSVNQLNAKVKIQEIWKSINIEDYPLKIKLNEVSMNQTATRAMVKRTPIELGSTTLKSKTCISDAIKIWNIAPVQLHKCTSLYSLKKLTKEFVKTLPI